MAGSYAASQHHRWKRRFIPAVLRKQHEVQTNLTLLLLVKGQHLIGTMWQSVAALSTRAAADADIRLASASPI
jgi:hypothetical protein